MVALVFAGAVAPLAHAQLLGQGGLGGRVVKMGSVSRYFVPFRYNGTVTDRNSAFV